MPSLAESTTPVAASQQSHVTHQKRRTSKTASSAAEPEQKLQPSGEKRKVGKPPRDKNAPKKVYSAYDLTSVSGLHIFNTTAVAADGLNITFQEETASLLAKAINVFTKPHYQLYDVIFHSFKLLVEKLPQIPIDHTNFWRAIIREGFFLDKLSGLKTERFAPRIKLSQLDSSIVTFSNQDSKPAAELQLETGQTEATVRNCIKDIFDQCISDCVPDDDRDPFYEHLRSIMKDNAGTNTVGSTFGSMLRRMHRSIIKRLAFRFVRRLLAADADVTRAEGNSKLKDFQIEQIICNVKAVKDLPAADDDDDKDLDREAAILDRETANSQLTLSNFPDGMGDQMQLLWDILRTAYKPPAKQGTAVQPPTVQPTSKQSTSRLFADKIVEKVWFSNRVNQECPFNTILGCITSLGTLCSDIGGLKSTEQAGIKMFPERRKDGRLAICNTLLRRHGAFAELRKHFSYVYNAKKNAGTELSWKHVLLGVVYSGWDATEFTFRNEGPGPGYAKSPGKINLHHHLVSVLGKYTDEDTEMSLVTDGTYVGVSMHIDNTKYSNEHLGWSGAPDTFIGVARLCKVLDDQLPETRRGFHAALKKHLGESTGAGRKGKCRPTDMWNAAKKHAQTFADNPINITSLFSAALLASSDTEVKRKDPFRHSTFAGVLVPEIVRDILPPEEYDKLCVLSIDPGLRKVFGGVFLSPVSAEGGLREAHDLHVHNADMQRDIGVDRAKSIRETHAPSFALDRKLRLMLQHGKQRFFHKFMKEVREYADELQSASAQPGQPAAVRDPIILIGDQGTSGGTGYRKPASKEFIKFLSEHFLVVEVGEYNTSQKCPRCWTQTTFANSKREIRTKECRNCSNTPCDPMPRDDVQQHIAQQQTTTTKISNFFKFDRDTGAGVSLASIFFCILKNWGRPAQFTAAPKQNGMPKHPSTHTRHL